MILQLTFSVPPFDIWICFSNVLINIFKCTYHHLQTVKLCIYIFHLDHDPDLVVDVSLQTSAKHWTSLIVWVFFPYREEDNNYPSQPTQFYPAIQNPFVRMVYCAWIKWNTFSSVFQLHLITEFKRTMTFGNFCLCDKKKYFCQTSYRKMAKTGATSCSHF